MTYVDIAGTRSYFGYDGSAVVIQGGANKGINFCVNNATFGSGNVMTLTSAGVLDVVSTARVSTLYADGDDGGASGTNALTNASNVTANSTGVGSIKFKGATSRDSTGFIKIYVGTTAYYIPIFSAITG